MAKKRKIFLLTKILEKDSFYDEEVNKKIQEVGGIKIFAKGIHRSIHSGLSIMRAKIVEDYSNVYPGFYKGAIYVFLSVDIKRQ